MRFIFSVMYLFIPLSAALAAEPSALPAPSAESALSGERSGDFERRLQRLESGAVPAPADPSQATADALNPAISLVLNGRLSALSEDPATYALPGFALGPDVGPGERGFSLGESELWFSANIDPNLYGSLTLALAPAGRATEVDLEEAYLQTLTLPYGLTFKAGRFNSRIGYLNEFHPHADDFADRPLPYRALFANSAGDEGVYADDGAQLRWLAPTDFFLELGAELFRGESFPAGGAANHGKGASTLFVHIGGDAGPSHAWRAGVSRLRAEARARATGAEAAPDLFTGTSSVNGVDFVWKWAPQGNPAITNFKLQAEYFTRDEDGEFDPASSGVPFPYSGEQRGWYAQAVYQFMPRWRMGLRFDRLNASAVDAALAGTVLDNRGHAPQRASAMLDFSGSEFSRLRFQYNRDESRADARDNQWTLQYIVSLGAHGAHAF